MMTVTQKRVGAAILLAIQLVCLASWVLDWNIFGGWDKVVCVLVSMFIAVYVFVIPPLPQELEKHRKNR